VNVRLLGTGAAEGIPALYCRCRVCEEAARIGGREVHTRSSVLIDGLVKVDHGPDTYAQKLKFGLDLGAVTTLLLTHAHEDHFTPSELIWRGQHFVRSDGPAPLGVFGNATAEGWLAEHGARYGLSLAEVCEELRIEFVPVAPFISFDRGPYAIHPLKAEHDARQVALNYVVAGGGRAILVGFDTARYGEAAWEYLGGFRLDCLLMDCTFGRTPSVGREHMALDDNVRVRDEMLRRGIIEPDARYVLTHISHGGDALHGELADLAAQHGMVVAYDGMEIEV